MPAVILSSINADLGPDPNYPWITIWYALSLSLTLALIVVCSWNLGAAVVVTIGGRLSDIFGRRWFLISGAVFGAIGAVVGATGQTIPQMIGAGVLMGIGGGFGEMIFASVQEIVPNERRLFILGILWYHLAFSIADGRSRMCGNIEPPSDAQPDDRICLHHACQTGLASLLLVDVCL